MRALWLLFLAALVPLLCGEPMPVYNSTVFLQISDPPRAPLVWPAP
jgi:hypothetical protein